MPKISSLIAPNFHNVHLDIKHNNHANYWLKGGRGSTKSSFISVEIILGMINDPNANAVVLRKVANTLRESVFDQYLWAIDQLGVSDFWQDSVSPLTLTYLPTGQQIRFKGADKPEKVKSQKFRRGYTKYKHFEEVAEFKSYEEIRSINQSLNRGGSDITTFYSYNPPASVNNWTNQAASHESVRDDTLVDESTYLTVPPEWLGKEFIADAEQLKKDNPRAYEHEYLGKVTGTGAEVFTNVELRKITDEEISHFDTIYRGLDFGFASDPLAYVELYYNAKYRTMYFYREIYKVGMSNRNAVDAIKKLNPNNGLITCDSAEPRTIAELGKSGLGLNLSPAVKGADSRNQGFKWLQDRRKIVIDPERCPNTAREFTTYELERDKNGNLKAIYPDGNDHSIDATRYSCERLSRKGGFRKWKP
ncbi:PBSX family phage terminase large subunit [Apilactobacillus micheneri]|uniref:PBSX family phage terminase large subunit n=1 Tax=Apilactobacillus micheneri TaxID=1899430 RepID=UPI00112B2CAC|nr:PBSX family phage terminase large subunit [Apilactobacillus micheneri]TPR48189.1 PBSX family phage terminase large subunit [Apilactobacillus micheneri]